MRVMAGGGWWLARMHRSPSRRRNQRCGACPRQWCLARTRSHRVRGDLDETSASLKRPVMCCFHSGPCTALIAPPVLHSSHPLYCIRHTPCAELVAPPVLHSLCPYAAFVALHVLHLSRPLCCICIHRAPCAAFVAPPVLHALRPLCCIRRAPCAASATMCQPTST